MTIEIPHYKTMKLNHLILDYNGTIATDGKLIPDIQPLLPQLAEYYQIHVITADTFGSVKAQLSEYPVTVKILGSNNHTEEKAAYIESLGKTQCIAIGNGNNDAKMLKHAALGIAIIGEEGCSTPTLMQSDLGCRHITDALSLLLHPKRLIATLRQ